MSSQLHSIHPKATIGKGTEIGPYSYVAEDVVIGNDCWIGPNVTIMDGARIGNNCKVFPGAVISAIPQDLKFEGENTLAEIGDNTTVRECVTINKGTKDRWTTKVGNNCLLMAYVHVAHDAMIGNNCIIANSANVAGHVTIDDWVIIIKAAREPLSFIGVNSIGLRRRGFENEVISQIEDIYRAIYVHNNNMSIAVKAADMELPNSKPKEDILDFIRSSDKGIIRGPF